jgi:uncharacterized protein (DUF1800 family)
LRIEAAIAANRFGLGAKPGDLAIIDNDPRGWLLDQLSVSAGTSAYLQDLPSAASIIVEVDASRRARRSDQKAQKANGDSTTAADPVAKPGSVVRRHYLQQTAARFQHAAATELAFHERLVHFWANHFAVSADKQPLSALAGSYENEAIRPNIDRHFYDLLLAAEQHPAMILYLDNQRSIGPNSDIANRAARGRRAQELGLNENLAREILELHTLGVNGGYTQDDVTTFARVITGWSIGGGENKRLAQGTPGTFEYRDNIHEPGDHTILGKKYPQEGLQQGEQVLQDLSRHPSTAGFIAEKLCRHFIADQPPAAAVERVAAVFRDTDGHLPAVHAALVDSAEAWQPGPAKFKTPQDFVISAFRAFNRIPENGRYIVAALDIMGQTPFRPGSPAGWPDTADHWGGADALYKRIEWSNTVVRLADQRVNPLTIGEAVLGPAIGDHSKIAIARADSSAQGITLLLMSPEFQRR